MEDDKKPDQNICGETFKIIPGKPFDFDERARTTVPKREERKLPPAPGRTPRADKAPADEILPRRSPGDR
jgi:hypothetical protein